jgi:hypothetical protein
MRSIQRIISVEDVEATPHTPLHPSPNPADRPTSSRIILAPSFLRPHLDEAQEVFNVGSRVESGKHKNYL